jgi:hypothetical protein
MDNPETLVAFIGYTIHRTKTNNIKQKAKQNMDEGLRRWIIHAIFNNIVVVSLRSEGN